MASILYIMINILLKKKIEISIEHKGYVSSYTNHTGYTNLDIKSKSYMLLNYTLLCVYEVYEIRNKYRSYKKWKKNGKESILLDIVTLIGSRSPVDTKNVCT